MIIINWIINTGKLVHMAQKVPSLKRLEEFFPHVIAAVKKMAGYSPQTNAYQTPSLALKLGYSLKKYIMMGYNVMAEYAKRYRSAALNTLKGAKWNMPQMLLVKLLNFHYGKTAKCSRENAENLSQSRKLCCPSSGNACFSHYIQQEKSRRGVKDVADCL